MSRNHGQPSWTTVECRFTGMKLRAVTTSVDMGTQGILDANFCSLDHPSGLATHMSSHPSHTSKESGIVLNEIDGVGIYSYRGQEKGQQLPAEMVMEKSSMQGEMSRCYCGNKGGTVLTTSGRYAAPSSVSESSASASLPPATSPQLSSEPDLDCSSYPHGFDIHDRTNCHCCPHEEYWDCETQPCPHTYNNPLSSLALFADRSGDSHIIIPTCCTFHPIFISASVSSSPPSVPTSPLPPASPIPSSAIPTLAPNLSPLSVSPAPLSPIASPNTDINMSSAALENLLQALVNNQNQLQQAITNLVNRPAHESSEKTAKLAPFKGEPAKLDSFLSLFILWAGEQKQLKLDNGKLNPWKCIAEALLMMEGPAAEWAAEYTHHISRVQAEEAGAVFPWEGNWNNFTHVLKVQFRVANKQQLAKNKLKALKQGDKTVAEFSQIFKMWAEKTGFSDQDLQYKFWKHLHKDLLFPLAMWS
ncbi:hypothetical protein D9758_005006 [Tetrapyrgos nigripes]|uniref:Retrotransposon gag domain-containing protein n=1 Tax=Tetrapyrgos nigripes TaxID=182062 RepID=A0A8H5GWE9_9AGAR|nr:hypothetical protein D9758_005006 [Tetrapyrgos nigripes]